jgi:hypothetical protein
MGKVSARITSSTEDANNAKAGQRRSHRGMIVANRFMALHPSETSRTRRSGPRFCGFRRIKA